MPTTPSKKHDIRTTLNFFKPNADGTPPAPAYIDRPESWERPRDTREVVICDVTGDEGLFSLEHHGFQFVTRASREKEFRDEERIREVYYRDVEELVTDV